ncbi:hypothetical protein [Streptomyces sp. NPDC003077]|uniref:hypothetical protein n=1 Tax=Streptomyces sp. NPDC003077 TaxID=3154443 RepID=UPI0033BCEA5F
MALQPPPVEGGQLGGIGPELVEDDRVVPHRGAVLLGVQPQSVVGSGHDLIGQGGDTSHPQVAALLGESVLDDPDEPEDGFGLLGHLQPRPAAGGVETGIETTTPVSRHQSGVSPCGVFDPCGNSFIRRSCWLRRVARMPG